MSKAESTSLRATLGDRRFTEFALEHFGVSEDAWDDATSTIQAGDAANSEKFRSR